MKRSDRHHRHRHTTPNASINQPTASDYEELLSHYTFLPTSSSSTSQHASNTTKSTWQERMVQTYHSHLYRSYVLADMTYYKQNKIGLRWRTEKEVKVGKGFDTCGNKKCPFYAREHELVEIAQRGKFRSEGLKAVQAYLTDSITPTSDKDNDDEIEEKRLKKVPHGFGLTDYEVNFAYVEQNQQKQELVKLKLCLRCAPMLFYNKGGCIGALKARQKNIMESTKKEEGGSDACGKTIKEEVEDMLKLEMESDEDDTVNGNVSTEDEENESSDDDDSYQKHKERKEKRRKRHRKHHRRDDRDDDYRRKKRKKHKKRHK